MADVINSGVPTPIQIYGRAPNGQLQAVTTDGAGNISFAGGSTPGGSNTQFEYNSAGTSFAGSPNLIAAASNTINVVASSGGGVFFNVLNDAAGAIVKVTNGAGTQASQYVAFNPVIALQEHSLSLTALAAYDTLFGDSTTHTILYANNGGTPSSFTGSWNNTNVTPVTVNANVSTAQNLMSVSIPAGTLNRVGRSLRIWCAGVYSTPAASSTTITVAVTLGGVTLLTITTTALGALQATNDQFNLSGVLSVQTGGASGVFEPHATLVIDLGAGNTVADSVFADTNTAVSSAINLTSAQTLQVTITFSAASASNSATQRQMVLETVG